MDFPIKMVIFCSYVSLLKVRTWFKGLQAAGCLQDAEGSWVRLDHEISAQLLVAWYCGEQLLDYSFQAWCPLPFCTKLHFFGFEDSSILAATGRGRLFKWTSLCGWGNPGGKAPWVVTLLADVWGLSRSRTPWFHNDAKTTQPAVAFPTTTAQ